MRPDDIFREFDRAFGPRVHGRFEPNADVYIDEACERIVVSVELAGSDAENLRVAVDDRNLYIAGSRVERGENRSASILRKEIQYGDFFKRIPLPLPVDDAKASATYRDGILTIALPVTSRERIPTVTTEIRMTVTRTLA